MAGDWIKMRVDLANDPAVIAIAAALGKSEDLIVGKLHKFWSWTDKHTSDGTLPGVTTNWIDKYLSVKGFAAQIEANGWLVINTDGVTIPKYEKHNGRSAKSRCDARNRALLSRTKRDKSVTQEKRREEYIVSNRDGPLRSASPLDLGQTAKRLRETLGKPRNAADLTYMALVGRAVDERHIAESLVQTALVGCEKADKPIAMFRDALQRNCAAAGGDVEAILRTLNGKENDARPA